MRDESKKFYLKARDLEFSVGFPPIKETIIALTLIVIIVVFI